MRLNVYKLIYLLYYFRKTILERNFFVIIKEIKLKIARMGWISDIKLFNKFYYNKQWYKTIELGEEILKSQKDNKSFLRKFGVAYFKINRIEKARLYIAQSLCLTINKDISHIVEIVEKDLITDNPEIYSQYDYIGGTDNLGFVKHKCIKNNEEYKYLTKIAQTNYPMDHYWNKESFFMKKSKRSILNLKT